MQSLLVCIPDLASIKEMKAAIVPELVAVCFALITEVDGAGEDAFETVYQTLVMGTVSWQFKFFHDFCS